MAVLGAGTSINTALLTWEGVTAHPHQFGGTEYRLGKREIGHIHGDSLVDIPLPRRVRDEVVADGRAQPHHVLPTSGWISFYLQEPEDVGHAISLFQLSFDLATKKHQPAANEEP